MGLKKQWSHLAEPRIPVSKADFSARASLIPSPEHLDRVHVNEWVWSESRAWLCAVLCEVLSVKTDGNLI